jgi:hypothetical protein
MERLNNCVSMVIQLWKPINLTNPEDGDDMFSETSVQTIAIWYKVPKGIFNLIGVIQNCKGLYSFCETAFMKTRHRIWIDNWNLLITCN